MPYKDPEKNKAYQREYQRKRKQQDKARKGEFLVPDDIDPAELVTVDGLKRILANHISLLNLYETDAIIRARAIAQLASIQAKIIETSELEKRIAEIEKKLDGKGAAVR